MFEISVTSSFCWDCDDRTAYLSIAGARVFDDKVFGGLTTALCQLDLKVMIVSSVSIMPSVSREISSCCLSVLVPLIHIGIYPWRSFLGDLVLYMLLGVQGWI